MATAPTFASTPKGFQVQIGIKTSGANTARDGTGTLGGSDPTMWLGPTGVAAGTRIMELVVQAIGNTSDGSVCVFFSPDGGTTKRLVDEIIVTANVVSAVTWAFRASRKYENLILPDASASLYYTTQVSSTSPANTFNVITFSGDLT
jgi:hypothetical protein